MMCRALRSEALPFMDMLVFRYNSHVGLVMIAATTARFLEEDELPALLCGEHPEAWRSECITNYYFVHAFLDVNLGFGSSGIDQLSRRLRSTNSGSDECLSLMRQWLNACTQQHGKICQNVDAEFVPTRLIDVSPELGSEAVKLVSMLDYEGERKSVKYAALSYCWGTDPFLTTTSSSIKAMHQFILLQRLPRTIQDAIRITRYMGLRYLWVDSLCIVQGTDKAAQYDWLCESWKMGHIYQSAYSTISAENAPAATVGIFNERLMPSGSLCGIPISEEESGAIYLGQHSFIKQQTREPLHCRAWTMQETMLSKRLLKFGTGEVSWQCARAEEAETRCETHSSSPLTMRIDDEQREDPNGQAQRLYDDWQAIVEDYSGRVLSKRSDKLPAIAGLAMIAQKATGDAYLAGVWCRHASTSLLWMHQRFKQEYVRRAEFQAPTWSWASVEGSVRFLQNHSQTPGLIVKFLPSSIKLSIRGLVMQLDSVRLRRFGSYYGGYDNFLPWADLCSSLKTYLDDLNEIPREYRRGGEGDPEELVNSSFLFLAQYKDIDADLGAGLIILPVEKSVNHYKRLGMFEGFPLSDLEPKQRIESKRPRGLKNLLRRKKAPSDLNQCQLLHVILE
ncbi:heterokaryon incompatibility protein-domain-containing protein [Clohesyomyces aquaticus]|uniref:Heterokaryon incompatibility protein-domain-containing protein n=1 Tax=Clohesyomyces aquaticus TaxID=1231657 RepID=A0A1Y1Y414_9PLEO|nr:heterokaryon incompatibility protein-domain-containing protein [Clohesyomyces aquaticus]